MCFLFLFVKECRNIKSTEVKQKKILTYVLKSLGWFWNHIEGPDTVFLNYKTMSEKTYHPACVKCMDFVFNVCSASLSSQLCHWEIMDVENIWKVFNQICFFLAYVTITLAGWHTRFFTETLLYLAHRIHLEELEMYSYRSSFLLHLLQKQEITGSARPGIIRGKEKLVLYSDNWRHFWKLISSLPLIAELLQKQRSLCHCSGPL